jgi:hypothetical protein
MQPLVQEIVPEVKGIEFTSSDYMFGTINLASYAGFSFCMLVSLASSPPSMNNQFLYDQSPGNTGSYLQLHPSTKSFRLRYYDSGSLRNAFTPNNTFVWGETYILTGSIGPNGAVLRVNGVQLAQNPSPCLGFPPATSAETFRIGARGSSNDNDVARAFSGKLGEMIFAAGGVNQNQLEKLEGFVAHQSKLSSLLPANHPYKNDNPGI